MSFDFKVETPDENIEYLARELREAGPEWLNKFGAHMVEITVETFDALARGGTYRGVVWPGFSRKPPAWRGGWSARLLDDTGRLKSSVGDIFRVEGGRLTLGSGVPYAAHQQRSRPFLFFQLPDDVTTAATIAAEFLKKVIN